MPVLIYLTTIAGKEIVFNASKICSIEEEYKNGEKCTVIWDENDNKLYVKDAMSVIYERVLNHECAIKNMICEKDLR